MATAANARVRGGAGSKLVSLASWLVAVYMTEAFFRVLAGAEGFGAGTLFAALMGQAVFTWGESPVWRGRGRWWNYAVLALDTVTNVGGLFVYMTRLDQTDSWAAFNDGLGLTGGINPLTALVVSIVVGVLLAATPEYLWRGE